MSIPKLGINFIGIGAQKAATTWLSDQFSSHHQIWAPPIKELQFFNEFYHPVSFQWCNTHRKEHVLRVLRNQSRIDMPDWDKLRCAIHIAADTISADWYDKIFSYAKENQIKGEITPEYSLLSEDNIAEISRYNPDLKVILIARSPFERACSQVKMNLSRTNFNDLSFEEKVAEAKKQFAFWDVKERGDYIKIRNKWTNKFGSGQLLMLDYRDVSNKPELVLDRVSEFLEVDSQAYRESPEKIIHKGQRIDIPEEVIITERKSYSKLIDNYETLFE